MDEQIIITKNTTMRFISFNEATNVFFMIDSEITYQNISEISEYRYTDIQFNTDIFGIPIVTNIPDIVDRSYH